MVFMAGKGVCHDGGMSDVDVPQEPAGEVGVVEVPVEGDGVVVDDAAAPVAEEPVVELAVEEAVDEAAPVVEEPTEAVRTFEGSVTLPELGGSLDSQIVVIGGVEYDQRFTPNPVLEAAARAAEADSL